MDKSIVPPHSNPSTATPTSLPDIVSALRADVDRHEQLLEQFMAFIQQCDPMCKALPAWTPKERGGVIELSSQKSKVHHVKERQGNSQDAFARLKATGLGKFYVSYLRHYPIVRGAVNWIWRNVYPIYVNHVATVATRMGNRNAKRWRQLTKLSEFAQKKRIPVIRVANAALVETPAPGVFPSRDQGYLASPHDGYNFPEVFVTMIGEGMIYGGTNLILANEGVICHDLYDFVRDYTSEELHGRNLIDPRKGRIRWLLHDEAPEHLAVAAAFVDSCAPNYAHWLTEVLPRIAAFCAEKKFKDIPIVINDGLHENIMESLLLVVGPEREIIALPVGRAIHVDALYLTSVAGYVPFDRRNNELSGHSHGQFSPRALELIRTKVASFAESLPEQAWPEKIYLRRNSAARKVTNAAELEAFLVAQGYVIVEPERLTFLQQAQLFRNSREIISATGAAISSAIFCKPGTRLGILMAKHENMIYRYWLNMFASLHINVSYVLGNIMENHQFGIHADFAVDLNNIDELLRSWQTK